MSRVSEIPTKAGKFSLSSGDILSRSAISFLNLSKIRHFSESAVKASQIWCQKSERSESIRSKISGRKHRSRVERDGREQIRHSLGEVWHGSSVTRGGVGPILAWMCRSRPCVARAV